MDIEKFNKDFTKKINSYENKWDETARLLHLVEEVGEFMEIIMQVKGFKKPPKNKVDITNALADILDDVLSLASLYQIDIIDIMNKTLEK